MSDTVPDEPVEISDFCNGIAECTDTCIDIVEGRAGTLAQDGTLKRWYPFDAAEGE